MAVNDASVLIDLAYGDLVGHWFALGIEYRGHVVHLYGVLGIVEFSRLISSNACGGTLLV